MRKQILMGFGLAVALAGTSAAQQGAHDGHGTKAPQARGERFEKRGGAPDGFLLQGITLTDAQKTQFATLRQSERERMKAGRESSKTELAAIREARQRGDTAAARAQMQKLRQAKAQTREQHLTAVRNILTAEQRVQLDKNLAERKERVKERRQAKGR